MVQPTILRLEELIEWHFHVAEQHYHARYGTFNNQFWKQYLPGGTVVTLLHPPKKIPKALYDHAKKIAKA